MYYQPNMKRITIAAILATLIIANWLSPASKPQPGQPCGPEHRWIERTSNVLNTELDCSPD